MGELLEFLWEKLEHIFQMFVTRLSNEHTNCQFCIGTSRNHNFPLRAYLSVLKNNDSAEVSISVDVKKQMYGLLVEADVVGEDGMVIVDGPSLLLNTEESEEISRQNIEQWLNLFDHMFWDNLADIDVAIKKMKSV